MEARMEVIEKLQKDARDIFNHGLQAVEPKAAVERYCRIDGDSLKFGEKTFDISRIKNIYVIGSGKASAPMAAAIEEIIGNRISGGIVNVKYGHTEDLKRIKLIEAGHPVPDENGQTGASEIYHLVSSAGETDLVICLISGGGSALLPLAATDLTLKDKQDTTNVLLACGATIHEINAIRKHLSRVKGGQLAKAAYPASIVTMMLSDVVGDDLDVIGSGPTVPDSSTYSDCMDIFAKYDIIEQLPGSVLNHIQKGVSQQMPETPKPGDKVFEKAYNLVIGSNIEAVIAACKKAQEVGYHTLILSSMIEGETKDVARVHTAIAREILKTGHPLNMPACVLSGGETTVTIRGKGLGGRNQEFVLAAAIDIKDQHHIVVLSAGTDGNDGPTDAAGAMSDSTTVRRAESLDMNPSAYLSRNDSYHFFQKTGDLLITGPTNTNVMDLRIMLIV